MALLRNFLTLLGLAVCIGGGYGYAKMAPILAEFDPGYMKMYTGFATRLLDTMDPGEAMMWAVPVEDESLTPEDIKDSLKSLASARDFLFVGDAPFYKQVKAVTGEDYRHVSFMSFCDVRVGKMMADYRDAYTGFMPCRISIVEDKSGKLWLYSMNLDMMIYGGRRLPDELHTKALRVRNVIWDMMQGAANGEL